MSRAALGLALIVAAALPAKAQTPITKLVVNGYNGNLGNTAATDFDQGYIDAASSFVYTVTLTKGDDSRTTAVYVRADAATMTGGKSVSDCSWSRADLPGTWNTLTTTDVLVESRVVVTKGTVWTNNILLRCNLNWATDPVASNSVGLTFSLTVSP